MYTLYVSRLYFHRIGRLMIDCSDNNEDSGDHGHDHGHEDSDYDHDMMKW